MRYRATAALACVTAALVLPAAAQTTPTESSIALRPDGGKEQVFASDGHREVTQIDGVKGTVAADGSSRFVPVGCGTPQIVGTERGRVECRKTPDGYFSFVPVQATYACTVAPTARRFILSFEPTCLSCSASEYRNSSADAQQAWGEAWPAVQPARLTAAAAAAADAAATPDDTKVPPAKAADGPSSAARRGSQQQQAAVEPPPAPATTPTEDAAPPQDASNEEPDAAPQQHDAIVRHHAAPQDAALPQDASDEQPDVAPQQRDAGARRHATPQVVAPRTVTSSKAQDAAAQPQHDAAVRRHVATSADTPAGSGQDPQGDRRYRRHFVDSDVSPDYAPTTPRYPRRAWRDVPSQPGSRMMPWRPFFRDRFSGVGGVPDFRGRYFGRYGHDESMDGPRSMAGMRDY